MTPSWREATLGEVTDIASGGTPSKQNPRYWDGTIPWISAKDMKVRFLADSEDHITEAGLKSGVRLAPAKAVLLLARGMTLLNDVPICVTVRPMAFNQDVKAITAKNGLAQEYLPYLLFAAKARLLSLVDLAGHGTGRLNTDELRNLRILLPPESEQRAIARVLRALDDKIELLQRTNATLEEIARAIFKSWFVDFDPIRGNAEHRNVWSLSISEPFSRLFHYHGAREIPIGWDVKTIEHLAVICGGGTPSTGNPAFWDAGTHFWATPKDLSALQVPILRETERRITDLGLAQVSSGLLPVGTVLLSSRAPIGYLAITDAPVAINQGFIAMKPRPGVPSAFLLLWAEWAQTEILSRANGSTFQEISKSNFRGIEVVSPPNKILQLFDEIVRPMFQRIALNERQSTELATIRDALLPRLTSGDVRVSAAGCLPNETEAQ
ncbi:MAG: restriction endonuclease subunit S [Candidatus Cybelea sp.]